MKLRKCFCHYLPTFNFDMHHLIHFTNSLIVNYDLLTVEHIIDAKYPSVHMQFKAKMKIYSSSQKPMRMKDLLIMDLFEELPSSDSTQVSYQKIRSSCSYSWLEFTSALQVNHF